MSSSKNLFYQPEDDVFDHRNTYYDAATGQCLPFDVERTISDSLAVYGQISSAESNNLGKPVKYIGPLLTYDDGTPLAKNIAGEIVGEMYGRIVIRILTDEYIGWLSYDDVELIEWIHDPKQIIN